jgi:hypothetical protein
LKVAHRPLGEMPDRLAVKVDGKPVTDVSYPPVPGGRGTLFAVNENRLGDALLAAVSKRPVAAEVHHGRAVVTLAGVNP